jgi:hypothetical protein
MSRDNVRRTGSAQMASDKRSPTSQVDRYRGIRPSYEAGMSITFDERTRCVTITFRGKTKTFTTQLPREGGIRAGEEYCKAMGWDPTVQLIVNASQAKESADPRERHLRR